MFVLVRVLFVMLASLLLLCLCAVEPEYVSASSSVYTFCYSITASNPASSPIPSWAIRMSGSLNVSTNTSGSGLIITAATGQRVVYYLGMNVTQSILNVAPVNAWNANDNQVLYNGVANLPYLDSTAIHSLSFVLSTTAYFAYGAGPSPYVNVNNYSGIISESDNPPNDGTINTVISSFTFAPSSNYSAAVSCSFSSSGLPAFSIAQQQQLSSVLSWNFCYSFTGGPGDDGSNQNGVVWNIVASGTFNTTGYSGQVNGQTAYLITGITGTRSYYDGAGNIYSTAIVGVGPLNPLPYQPFSPLFSSIAYSSNLLYPTYPYFDGSGVALQMSSGQLANPEAIVANTSVRLYIDTYNMLDEFIINPSTAAITYTYVGNVDLALSTSNQAVLQCSNQAGTLQTYAFCYSLQSTPTTPSSQAWSIQVYGLFTAYGVQIRQGRQALTLQTMTGVRQLITGGSTYSQNIIKLVYINGDATMSDDYILNDNLVYLSSPTIDYFGIEFSLSSPIQFPSNIVVTTNDINLSLGHSSTWYEYAVLDGVQADTPYAGFNYTAYPASQSATFTSYPCMAISPSATSPSPIAAPYLYSYSYVINASSYTIVSNGSFVVYSTPINVGKSGYCPGYSLQSLSGTRVYQDVLGGYSVSNFTAPSSDGFGSVNFTYNQLIYPTTPNIDQTGLLLSISAGAISRAGPIIGDPVVRLFWTGLGSNSITRVAEQVMTSSGLFVTAAGTFTVRSIGITSPVSCVVPSSTGAISPRAISSTGTNSAIDHMGLGTWVAMAATLVCSLLLGWLPFLLQ